MEKQYDVFISYRSVNRAWAEVLTKNLKQCGLEVFFDCWHIIPGDNIDAAVWKAIKVSRAAVFIDTPESAESQYMWKDEYPAFRRQGVRLIRLHFGSAVSDIPFLSNLLGIDFSNPESKAYSRSFRCLLSGLRNEAPGEDPPPLPVGCELIIPASINSEPDQLPDSPLVGTNFYVVNEVFDHLCYHCPVVVLAQDGWDRSLIHRDILKRAREVYSSERVEHLVAPLYEGISEERYFADIICKLKIPVYASTSSTDCYLAIRERVMEHDSVFFLLITRMESGDDEGRRKFATLLRALSEEIPDRFKVVLCGAEKLAELCFRDGTLSLLNSAKITWWPDPTYVDLLAWQHERYPEDPEISEVEAQNLLSLCGGHPRLIHEALISRHVAFQINGIPTKQEIKQKLADSATIASAFTVCRSLPKKDLERICKWLKDKRVASYEHWPEDEVLQKLFWKNLLTRSACGKYFEWRCSLVQEVGSKLLKGSL